jgi:hypothetical protein
MNTKTLLTLSFIFILLNTKAQDSIRYKNTIKFIPTKFLNYHSGIEFEFEHFITKNTSFQAALAYCYPNGISSEDKNGFRAQLEWKYYFSISNRRFNRHLFYFAPNLMYSKFNSQYYGKEYYTFQEVEDIYYKKVEIPTIKDAYSINIKAGYVFQHKRVALELYTGSGIKYLEITADKKISQYYRNDIFILNNPGKYWLPNFLGGLKIGYNF